MKIKYLVFFLLLIVLSIGCRDSDNASYDSKEGNNNNILKFGQLKSGQLKSGKPRFGQPKWGQPTWGRAKWGKARWQ